VKKLLSLFALSILALLSLLTISFFFEGMNYEDVNYVHIISNKASAEVRNLDLNVSREYTLSKGFQIIDGNIHDRYGNLAIPLDEHGFTPDGTTISAGFSIIYATDQNMNYEYEDIIEARNVPIFDGTTNLRQNVNGTEGVRLGSDFTLTSANPSVNFRYISGSIIGVNFSLINVTTNQTVRWFPDVRTGNVGVTHNNAFNSERPSDSFRVLASGAGGSGNVALNVRAVR